MEEDSDIYFRYVLSTLTGLKKLSVGKISNLTKIDFLNTVQNLSELDYRGTGVEDVTILNTNGLRIGTLFTNGAKTDLSTIQETLNRMINNRGLDENLNCAWRDEGYNNTFNGMLHIENYNGSNDAFANCTSLDSLAISGSLEGAQNFDLSNCNDLKNMNASRCSLVLPSVNFEKIFYYGNDCLDFSKTISVSYLDASEVNLNKSLETMTDCRVTAITNRVVRSDGVLDGYAKLTGSRTTLKRLQGQHQKDNYYGDPSNWYNEGNFSNFVGFTALETIYFANVHNPDIITGIENITNLKILNLRVNEITNISNLHSLNLMEELYLGDNKISDLYYNEDGESRSIFENMSHLKVLELNNNQIEDLSALKPLLNFKGQDRKTSFKNIKFNR